MTTTNGQTEHDISGWGRDQLIAALREAREDRDDARLYVDVLLEDLRKLTIERKALTDNVTAVQQRCTELVRERRLHDIIEADPKLTEIVLELAYALIRARRLHPEGSSLGALVEEVGEVAKALGRQNAERYHEELVDTGVVAIRLLLGDVDVELQPKTPFARSPKEDALTPTPGFCG